MQTKSIRQVKLYSKYRPSQAAGYPYGKDVPWLNVSGMWLEQAGFHIGDAIEISIQDNQLIIKHSHADGNQRH